MLNPCPACGYLAIGLVWRCNLPKYSSESRIPPESGQGSKMTQQQTTALERLGWVAFRPLLAALVVCLVSFSQPLLADDSIRFVERVDLSGILPNRDQDNENIRAELDVPLDFLDIDRAADPIRLRPLDDAAPFAIDKLAVGTWSDITFLRQTANLQTALRRFDGRWSLMHGAQRALGETFVSLHQGMAEVVGPQAVSDTTQLRASGAGLNLELGKTVSLSARLTAFLEDPTDPLAGVSDLHLNLGSVDGTALDVGLLLGRISLSFGYLRAEGFGYGRMQTYALGIAYMGDRFSTYLTASRFNIDPNLLMLADVDEVLALEWGAAYRLNRSLFLFGRIRVADYSNLYGLGFSGLNSLYFVGTRFGF